jgi:hypothetical protein
MSTDPRYEASCEDQFVEGALRGGFCGAVWGAISVTRPHHVGARSPLLVARAVATSVVLFGAVVGLFQGVSCFTGRLRGRKDYASTGAAGFVAGTFIGAPTRHVPTIFGCGVVGAVVGAAR